MSVTTELGPDRVSARAAYAPVSLERTLARIDELLVRRSSDPAWFSSLARTLDALGASLAEHREAAEGHGGWHSQILEEHPRLSFEVRSLQKDHVELAAEIAELRKLVTTSATTPGRLPVVLAATTEVVARIRGHQRRLGTVLHEAYQRDLGGGD